MDISTLTAALLTIAIFSFLYRDNPLYRFAEHLLIGLSVGFTLVLLFESVLMPKLFHPLFAQGRLLSIIPLLLGLSMFGGLTRRLSEFTRPALALMIGAGAGVSIPAMLEARILRQMSATVEPFSLIGSGAAADF
jgi:uncharacterized membrane protein YccC